MHAALLSFIQAFEAGDIESMKRAFSPDATSFPRSAARRPTASERARRTRGIDPEMVVAIDAAKAAGIQPPYFGIEPRDLDIRVSGDMALATFHLERDGELGRRTFVLRREDDSWKILHVHASNVIDGDGHGTRESAGTE